MVVGTFGGWTGRWVGARLVGWLHRGRFVSGGGVFVPAGGGRVAFVRAALGFLPYTGLTWRSSSTSQLICLLLDVLLNYRSSTWSMGWSVGRWLG